MALNKVTHSMILGDPAYLIDFGGGVGKTAAENDAAFTAAFAANNTVILPSGTITYSTTIALNSNKSLIGEGSELTILEYTGTSHGIAVTNSGNNLKSLQVKASSSAASGIYLNNATINYFEQVYVTNNPPTGWWLYGDDTNRSVYWNTFRDCGCNNAVLPVLLEGTGTGAVNANTWYDGTWRTSNGASPSATVCYLNGGGNGTGGNNFIGGDWTGYGCNSFVLDGTASCTQNSFFGLFIDTGANTGIVLNAGVSTTTIMGGVWQATTPVVQNNIAGGTNQTDIIMISSLRYLPFIQQSAFVAPTLLNSWVNYGGTAATVAYYKDPNQIVHIEGVVKSGTTTAGTSIFVLPAGFRPLLNHTFAQLSYNGATAGFAGITVSQNGTVAVETTTGNTFLSIDCSFKAEQ